MSINNNTNQEKITKFRELQESGKYSDEQLSAIMYAMDKGLSVNLCNPELDSDIMYNMAYAEESNIDMTEYYDKGYTASQFFELRKGKELGVNVKLYENKEYDWMQMEQILLGLLSDADVTTYADPSIPWYDMLIIRLNN